MHTMLSKSNCGSQDNENLISTLSDFFGTKIRKLKKLMANSKLTDLDCLESSHIIVCKLLQDVSSSKPKGA